MESSSRGSGTFGIRRLVDLCIETATRNGDTVEKWRRQRRTLERLPSQLSDELFRRLVRRRLLFPSLLEVFQWCVEDVDLKGEFYVDAEWMAYLGSFRYLRNLNLADCRAINNAALWPITGMTTLKELDLSRCLKITDGGIEHVLSNSNLEKLSVSETKLTNAGVMHFKSLKNLLFLDLGGLPVTDEALRSLQVLTQLENLNLWGSLISNEGAHILKMFPKLKFLNVAWTNVSELPNLPSVTYLNMSNCTISSIFNKERKCSELLEKLIVSGATISNLDEAFCYLPKGNLSFLDLSKSSLCNFHCLVDMKSLEHLDLSFSRLTDDLTDSIICIGEKLKDLNLSNTKVSSQGVADLAGHVPNLENLCLSCTAVDDSVLPYIGTMHSLKVVDLSKTNIKGFTYFDENNQEKILSLTALQNLNNLQSLNLEETHVGDETLHPLASLKELESLFLNRDFISDISLHIMSHLLNLKCLGFRGAVLTNSGLNSFKPPEMLQVLDLRGCWLLTEDELLSFCNTHPKIEVRHEFQPTFLDNQHALASTSSLHAKNQPPQARSCRSKLSQLSQNLKEKCVDERIKYTCEELLQLLVTAPANLDIELPEMVIKD